MKKKILVALAGAALLAACSDNASPDGFRRSFARHECLANHTSDPRRVMRYCADEAGAPLSGIFQSKSKLGETLREHYIGGYIVFAERFDPAGNLAYRATSVIEGGLIMQVDSMMRYMHEGEPLYVRVMTLVQPWGAKSMLFKHDEAAPIFISCNYLDESRAPVSKAAADFACPK
jgi:hypothetical protein